MNADPLFPVLVRRLRALPVEPFADTLPADLPAKRAALLAELAALGFRVENPEALTPPATAALLARHGDLFATLAEMKGAATADGPATYVPLFDGFPDRVPEDREYFARRLAGCFVRAFGLAGPDEIPPALFDPAAFGADPVTQMQRADLHAAGAARQAARAADGNVEWVALTVMSRTDAEAAARDWLRRTLAGKASVPVARRPDLAALLAHFGTDGLAPADVPFGETRALVSRALWEAGRFADLAPFLASPQDVLKLCADLTGTDVSLSNGVRFPRFTRPQRRCLLAALEACGERADEATLSDPLPEGFKAHAGLWLELGRWLHPGEYKARYPRAFAAFDAVRNEGNAGNGRVETWGTRVEAASATGDPAALARLLSARPGAFARRLHHALAVAGADYGPVLAAFERVADQVPAKVLLTLAAHLPAAEDSDVRCVINKRGRAKVLPNTPGRLAPGALGAVTEVLNEALAARFARLPSWEGKTAAIDPALKTVTVPLWRRASADGLRTLERGSRVPLATDPVAGDAGPPPQMLRLFVYWKEAAERTDLDLSLIEFGPAFEYRGQVSYTNLKTDGVTHSGDIQSAPRGACEFIDVDLARVRERMNGEGYLAILVNRYCGESFGACAAAQAGWMLRDRPDAGRKAFDPAAVRDRFALTGAAGYALPLAVDLSDLSAVCLDLYVSGAALHNRVEGQRADVATLTREVARFTRTRPTLADLAERHAAARGATRVPFPEDGAPPADVTFGLEAGDYTAADPEKILSELI